MIVALAGRRIDAAEEPNPQFPLANVPAVRERMVETFQRLHPTTLVCAAACGADLLALDIAEQLRIGAEIVLPFAPAEFKRRSVTDRPGEWSALFEYHIGEAQRGGALHVLDLPDEHGAYQRTNEAILDQAQQLAERSGEELSAVVVWNGPVDTRTDYTAQFVERARSRGIAVTEVRTV